MKNNLEFNKLDDFNLLSAKINDPQTDLIELKNNILRFFRNKEIDSKLTWKWIDHLNFRNDVSVLVWLIELKIKQEKFDKLDILIKSKIERILTLLKNEV